MMELVVYFLCLTCAMLILQAVEHYRPGSSSAFYWFTLRSMAGSESYSQTKPTEDFLIQELNLSGPQLEASLVSVITVYVKTFTGKPLWWRSIRKRRWKI